MVRNVIAETLIVILSRHMSGFTGTEAAKQKSAQFNVCLFFAAKASGSILANYYSSALMGVYGTAGTFLFAAAFAFVILLHSIFLYEDDELTCDGQMAIKPANAAKVYPLELFRKSINVVLDSEVRGFLV